MKPARDSTRSFSFANSLKNDKLCFHRIELGCNNRAPQPHWSLLLSMCVKSCIYPSLNLQGYCCLWNKTNKTHPLSTPKTKFSMKKDPTTMRGIKKAQLKTLPRASLVCKDKHETVVVVGGDSPSIGWESSPPWWHTGRRWAWQGWCCRRLWCHCWVPPTSPGRQTHWP